MHYLTVLLGWETLEQWRSTVGCWVGNSLRHSSSDMFHSFSESACVTTLNYFMLAVLAALLVIAGVEMNPGPVNKGKTFHYPHPPTVSKQEYMKREGTADTDGQMFEVNMAAFLFIKGMFETSGFHLATNVDGAGAFDDFVFRFKDRHTKQEQTRFLQLKHKKKKPITHQGLCAKGGDLSLRTYYTSYYKIQKNLFLQNNVLFEGSFDNCEFALYTNAKLNTEKGCSKMTDAILNSGGKVWCFESNSEEYKVFSNLDSYRTELQKLEELDVSLLTADIIRKELNKHKDFNFKELLGQLLKGDDLKILLQDQLRDVGDTSLWQQFMQKLRIYTCQDVKTAVEKDIEMYFGTSGKRTQEIFCELQKGIMEWWRDGNYFLSENYAPFWPTLMENHISGLGASLGKKLGGVAGLRFQDSQDLPTGSQFTHIVINGSTELICLKINQKLEDEGHVLVDSSTLEDHLSEVLAVWGRATQCDVLVVDGGTGRRDVIMGITDVLNWCPVKRLVLLAASTDPMARDLLEMFKGKKYEDSFTLDQLEQDSQNQVLNHEVIFQGSFVKLRSLVNEAASNHVTADIVVRLFTGNREVTLGEKLAVQDDCYIPRTLLRREHVDKEIFSAKEPDHLAVSGATVQELEQLLPTGVKVEKFDRIKPSELKKYSCYIIDSASDFIKLSEIHDKIHWIHKRSDSFVWKQSKGGVTFITKHIAQTKDHISYSNIHKIMELSHQMVLVVAEPGMGKSTEMAHVASEVKKTHPASWVVSINLNDHTDHLSQDQPSTVDLLTTASKFNTKFERALFEHEIHNGGNVVVLFDGFDEISPNYADKVIRILRDISGTEVKKVWIMSRPVMRETLEREFSSISFAIKPFSQDDQENFLLKFWKGTDTGTHKLDFFITKLLGLTVISLNDPLAAFTGIPLQTKMLAEAFHAEAINYCMTGAVTLPDKLDLLQLYNRFVDRKWEIYYEKNRMDVRKAAVASDHQELRNMFQQKYMSCALVTLLETKDIENLQSFKRVSGKVQEFLNRFKKGLDKRGLVIDVVNYRPVFAHRTFAEYFAAIWLTQNYKIEQQFLEEGLFDANFQIVRNFFDLILAKKFPLHVAVLKQDKGSVETLLEQQHDVNTRDKGGRTTLHLAVMSHIGTPDEDDDDDPSSKKTMNQIMELLLEHGTDPGLKDAILCWRPLRIAERIRAWSAVDVLLANRADSSDLVLTRKNINNEEYVQEVLGAAARQGLVHLVTFMLQCGLSMGHTFLVKYWGNDSKVTLLHESARCGQVKLVEFLLDKEADVEARDKRLKSTALMWAAEEGRLEVVELLIQRGASVTSWDKYGNTALLVAARNEHCEVFRLLSQQKDTDLWACDSRGNNALHLAAYSGSAEMVAQLLDMGIFAIDCHNKEQKTPLSFAAYKGQLEVTQLLCERGADLNSQDIRGRTPLHVAAMNGQLEVVELLIQRGASVTSRDKYGNTALLVAASKGHWDVFRLLSQHKDTDVTACDYVSTNALHFAALSGSAEMVAQLLDMGIFAIDCRNKDQRTPLWFAAWYGRLEVTQLLCERGADLKVQDIVGWTPLHIAAMYGRLQIVKFLVQNGASLTARDKWGRTPLDVAVKKGRSDVTKFLRNITQ